MDVSADYVLADRQKADPIEWREPVHRLSRRLRPLAVVSDLDAPTPSIRSCPMATHLSVPYAT